MTHLPVIFSHYLHLVLCFGLQYLILASIDAAMGKWLVTIHGFYSGTAAGWFGLLFFFLLKEEAWNLPLKGAASEQQCCAGEEWG